MDPIHFTAARNAGLDRSRTAQAAFYNTHSFEQFHRFTALARRILAWRPSRLRRVQPRQNTLGLAHAR